MKVLVIPDVHLKTWIFDRAEEIMKSGKAERAVCLMDIPDDWSMEFQVEKYKETYDRAIAFADSYSDTLWCYGNHDISYLWGKLESGYSPYAENTVITKLEELELSLPDRNQLAIIHRIDKVLFSHGGLSKEYIYRINEELLESHIDEVLDVINQSSTDRLWIDESPLWLRPQYGNVEAFRNDEFKQVVGHTPVDNICEKDGFISTDVYSTYRDGRQIGESAMIVIETETGVYEKVKTAGKFCKKLLTPT